MSSALAVSARFYPSNRLCSNRRSGSRRNSRFTGSNICVKATAIEKELAMAEKPETFLRQTEEWDVSVRARFEKTIRKAQDEVCSAVEAVDGTKFREDVWSRPGGGGGISRVLQDGNVWEKAGVNVSVVYGNMPPEAYRAANPGKANANANANTNSNKLPSIPFFAAGISSVNLINLSTSWSASCAPCNSWDQQVMHPKNPFAPTVHFNYRYFETDAPKDVDGAPRKWWFGGGTDLTPSYVFEEDVRHFHMLQKQACDKYDPTFYPKYKKWCDDYFLIKHRGERRGLGGIFFDDLNDQGQEFLLEFTTDCMNSVIPAYIPIIVKRMHMPFTEKHKSWQQLRRGRYVEFNLVYDRGTTFGLKTGGRIESILMSLPLTARWEYDHQPEENSDEWKLLDACTNPKEWL